MNPKAIANAKKAVLGIPNVTIQIAMMKMLDALADGCTCGVTPEPEPVVEKPEPASFLAEMTKKELEAYARLKFNIELDLRHNKEDLIAQIIELQ